MNPLAVSLNETIQSISPAVFDMLSDLGKRMYFPKGILSQSAEAKQKATRFNATIGTALTHGKAMALPSVIKNIAGCTPEQALLYAPSPGNPALRKAWQQKDFHDNPDMTKIPCSLPVVTNGLSHALSLIGDIFGNPGDVLIYPDMNWGNYALNYVQRKELVPCTFSFFDGNGFNIPAFREALKRYTEGKKKVIVLLNFPNNPSGYTPTEAEGDAIAAALLELAESGVNVITIVDDAYFGLFFEPEVMRQSIFTKIACKHERLLAIKADAATKEVYVWGLRVGFVSIAVKSDKPVEPLYDAMNAKFGGCIRSIVSNCSALSQQLVLNSLTAETFYDERAANVAIIKERAQKVHEVLKTGNYNDVWTPYPFNSGYFMCLKIKNVDTETLRLHLLDKYGIGTIAITKENLRVAFSCIEKEDVQELFDTIAKACRELA